MRSVKLPSHICTCTSTHGLDYMRFSERVKGGADYDLADLTNLLRKDQKPDLDDMIRRVVEAIASSAK